VYCRCCRWWRWPWCRTSASTVEVLGRAAGRVPVVGWVAGAASTVFLFVILSIEVRAALTSETQVLCLNSAFLSDEALGMSFSMGLNPRGSSLCSLLRGSCRLIYSPVRISSNALLRDVKRHPPLCKIHLSGLYGSHRCRRGSCGIHSAGVTSGVLVGELLPEFVRGCVPNSRQACCRMGLGLSSRLRLASLELERCL